MKKVMAFAALAAFVATPVLANDGAKLFNEKTCNACHGPEDRKSVV